MIDPARLDDFVDESKSNSTHSRKSPQSRGIGESPKTLRVYLERCGVKVRAEKALANGSTVLILDGCPMNPDHGQGTDTAVVWRPSGIGFECKHDSCVGHTWSDLRENIDTREPAQSGGRVAATLVGLADRADLFHSNDVAFATVAVGSHRETHAIMGRGFKRWLMREYYETSGKPVKPEALATAQATLEARAIFDGSSHEVAVRVAQHEGAYYLDLCDHEWRVVRIDTNGWAIVRDCPIRFVRRPNMLALPEPVSGGSIDEFRELVNVPDDASWSLVLAWLVATFRPIGPYPALMVNGEQGSAKTTLCRMLRRLIDPNKSDLRAAPHDARDLAIMASNSWVMGLDNMSRLPPWLSDALCRLATGAGFTTRKLYTDDDEQIFEAQRPVLLNGIEDFVERADLLDRIMAIRLRAIPDDLRRDEQTLWCEFEAARPRILGAVLDAVAHGLGTVSTIRLASLPRMADFAIWSSACERGLGLNRGAFMSAYADDRAAVNQMALESSPLFSALRALLKQHGNKWQGTARELLAALESADNTDEKARTIEGWPTSPKKLGGDLRRLAPNLRMVGVDITEPTGKGSDRRTWRLSARSGDARRAARSQEVDPANAPDETAYRG